MDNAINLACAQIIHENKRISKTALKSLTTDQDVIDKIELYGSVRFAWHIVHDTWTIPNCTVCSKPTKWLDARRRYGLTCSKSCSNIDPCRTQKREQTLLEKYGVTNPSQSKEVKAKKRATTLKNHGVEYPAQSKEIRAKQQATTIKSHGVAFAMQSEKLREKQQNTMIDRYGVANAAHSQSLQDKKKETCLEKYGTEYAYGSNQVRDKIAESMMAKWGVENPSQHPDIQQKKVDTFINRYGVTSATYIGRDPTIIEILRNKEKFIQFITDKTIKESAEMLNVSVGTIFNKSKIYQCGDLFKYDFNGNSGSSYEKIILDLLNKHNIQYQLHNRKIIYPHELDIFIPDYNLAIEVGSSHWHGEQAGKYETYHLDKWKKCKDQGITLLQFFDNDLFKYWDLTESKILRCLNLSKLEIIGARKLTITKPSRDDERKFLNYWHTKGYAAVRYDSIGGYYKNELMGILTIKKTNNPSIIKIDRWATNINYSFPGLFSRLLSHWIKKENFKGIIETWCDNRLGDGKVYKSAGFVEKNVSTPGYWYFKNKGLENRVGYQRHKLQKIFNLSEEENRKELTEYDIMLKQGYDRLWDAGHTRWIKEIK